MIAGRDESHRDGRTTSTAYYGDSPCLTPSCYHDTALPHKVILSDRCYPDPLPCVFQSAFLAHTETPCETLVALHFSEKFGLQLAHTLSPASTVRTGAVQTLLISDSLFRMKNVAARARYAALVEAVRAAGGDALIFSAMHLSGEALNQLSGIAAILRFPLPELEELEMGDDGTLGEGRK